MKYFWHLRWFIPLCVVGLALWQVFFSTAELVSSTDFTRETPYFNVLQPASRVARQPQGIALLEQPVYVDIHLPPRAVALTLDLQTTSRSNPLRLAVQQSQDFKLVFPPLQESSTADTHTYHLTMTDFPYLLPRHTVRLVLSASPWEPGSVVVTGASVKVQRAPFSFGGL